VCIVVRSTACQVRLDAAKLTTQLRRPLLDGQGLGPWLTIFRLLTVASVATNALLISQTSTALQQLISLHSSVSSSDAVVVVEHVVLVFLIVLHGAVPECPKWVKTQRRRQQLWLELQALPDLHESEAGSDTGDNPTEQFHRLRMSLVTAMSEREWMAQADSVT